MKRFAILLALALAGCEDKPDPSIPLPPPQIKRTMLRETVPASMLHCAPEPDGSKVATAAEAATYIVDLREAGADCRRKLGATGKLIRNEAE